VKLSELFRHTSVSCETTDEVLFLARNGRNAVSGSLVCLFGEHAPTEAQLAFRQGARAFLCDRALILPDGATVLITAHPREDYAAVCAAFYGEPHKDMTLIGFCGGREVLGAIGLSYRLLNACGIPAVLVEEDGYQWNDIRTLYAEHPIGPRELYRALREAKRRGIRVALIHLPLHAVENDFLGGASLSALVCRGEDGYPPLLAANKDTTVICPSEAASYLPGRLTRTYGVDGDLCLGAEGISPCGARLSAPGVGLLSVPIFHQNGAECAGIAVSVAESVGISRGIAIRMLEKVSTVASLEHIPSEDGVTYLLDDSFTPVDTERALADARSHTVGQMIAVVGCVGMRDYDRRAPLGLLLERYADRAVLTADNPGLESVEHIANDILTHVAFPGKFDVIPNREAAIGHAVSIARPGDTVLLLGKGYEPHQLIGGQVLPYDEKATLIRTLRKKQEGRKPVCSI